jgi:hypothetical protein
MKKLMSESQKREMLMHETNVFVTKFGLLTGARYPLGKQF